jgi:hypothetical protein
MIEGHTELLNAAHAYCIALMMLAGALSLGRVLWAVAGVLAAFIRKLAK